MNTGTHFRNSTQQENLWISTQSCQVLFFLYFLFSVRLFVLWFTARGQGLLNLRKRSKVKCCWKGQVKNQDWTWNLTESSKEYNFFRPMQDFLRARVCRQQCQSYNNHSASSRKKKPSSICKGCKNTALRAISLVQQETLQP